MDSVIWRGMTRAELDAAYNNSAAVRNSAEKLADWSDRSAKTRSRSGVLLDLAYGPRPRNRIDIFPCGHARAPLFAFIHGGYWQRNSKEIFACMAEGALANGFDAALIGYTLAPAATLSEIVDEVRTAMRWLRAEGRGFGIPAEKIVLSGWSAGGHCQIQTKPACSSLVPPARAQRYIGNYIPRIPVIFSSAFNAALAAPNAPILMSVTTIRRIISPGGTGTAMPIIAPASRCCAANFLGR